MFYQSALCTLGQVSMLADRVGPYQPQLRGRKKHPRGWTVGVVSLSFLCVARMCWCFASNLC
jgi:hypothetical protein